MLPPSSGLSMKITDHFEVPDQGTVVVGIIAAGFVTVNDTLHVHTSGGPRRVTVGAIEVDNESRSSAGVGETVGILLRGESLEGIARGQVLTSEAAAAKQRDPERVCPKCGGGMVEGFIGDHTQGNLLVARWFAGRPRAGIFWEVDPTGVETWKVTMFRCRDCGFLEAYAGERVQ